MKRPFAAVIIVFIFGGIVGCFPSASRLSQKPVIQVNDQSMSLKEFSDKLARELRSYDALAAKDPVNIKRCKDEILRVFIMNGLVENYAKQNHIDISDADVNTEIAAIRKNYPDDNSFRHTLANENISFSDWRTEMKKSLLEKKVFGLLTEKIPVPAEAEIKKYYEINVEKFRRKERVYVRQVVLDELGKAQAVRDELKKKDFAETARKYSVAPEAKAGGLVGWIEKGSVDVFDKAFNMTVGSISPVLESSYGFHIFKVERRAPPGVAPLEEVRPLIVQALRGQREQAEFANWLDKQIRASHVLKDNDLIRSVSVETRGTL